VSSLAGILYPSSNTRTRSLTAYRLNGCAKSTELPARITTESKIMVLQNFENMIINVCIRFLLIKFNQKESPNNDSVYYLLTSCFSGLNGSLFWTLLMPASKIALLFMGADTTVP
jgi:hypothetical protein